MDRTKQYIKMCEKAIEIQSQRDSELWQDGDFYTDDIQKRRNKVSAWTDVEDMPYSIYHPIWLPRQDQLQEMIKSEPYFAWNHIGQLGRWADKNPFTSAGLNSMEQLWLACMMEEKYNKMWDGKDWIKNER